MIGLVAGDIIGSAYERHNTNRQDFELFTPQSTCTDDSVLAVAVADAILHGRDFAESMRDWAERYPHAGYGPGFLAWLGGQQVSSKGNGAAMRVAAIAWLATDFGQCMAQAEAQARITHGTPEGLTGALAVAAAIYWAKEGASMTEIENDVQRIAPGYDLSWPRPRNPSALARESVPAAIAAAIASTSWEDAVRRAVALGGDTDTVGAIAGAIAEAYYGGVPPEIRSEVLGRVPEDMLVVLEQVESRTRTTRHWQRSTDMAKLTHRDGVSPNSPFSGNCVIFGIAPRGSSNPTSPTSSEAEPASTSGMAESEQREQLAMMKAADAAMSKDKLKD